MRARVPPEFPVGEVARIPRVGAPELRWGENDTDDFFAFSGRCDICRSSDGCRGKSLGYSLLLESWLA